MSTVGALSKFACLSSVSKSLSRGDAKSAFEFFTTGGNSVHSAVYSLALVGEAHFFVGSPFSLVKWS